MVDRQFWKYDEGIVMKYNHLASESSTLALRTLRKRLADETRLRMERGTLLRIIFQSMSDSGREVERKPSYFMGIYRSRLSNSFYLRLPWLRVS